MFAPIVVVVVALVLVLPKPSSIYNEITIVPCVNLAAGRPGRDRITKRVAAKSRAVAY